MQTSQLPYYIQIITALGPLIVTAVIGTFAAYIAWQQWRTAEKKRNQDLFDRRFAVFEAARNFLGDIQMHGKPSRKAIRAYVIGTSGAEFLFDDDVHHYLKEIIERAFKMAFFEGKAEHLRDGDDQRGVAIDKAEEQALWLLDKVITLESKFKPFLKVV
jgi:hypothetical protein